MKTTTKVIIGLIFALLIAIGLSIYFHQKSTEVKPASAIEKVAKKNVQTAAKKIAEEVDKNGLEHTISKMAKEIDQSAVDAVKADLLDTAAALGIARDQIKQITAIAASLSIKNQQLERRVGDIATTYSHTDDHFRLTINVPKDSLKVATFDAGYDADLITTQYRKGSWLFGVNNYMDIYSNDPRFTIKGVRTLTIKENKKFFGADLQATSEYNGTTKTLMIGPSLGVDLGRFNLRGKYLFEPSNQKWSWVASGGYRIAGI